MTHRLWESRESDGSAGYAKVDLSTQSNHVPLVVKQKQGQVLPLSKVAAATLQAGLGPRTKKRSKLIRMPSSCVRMLRDAYVSFMMSIAGKSNFNTASVGYTTWPCAGVPSRYPGRRPRDEMSDEEMACASIVLETPTATTGMQINRSPPCTRKAVFPLSDRTTHDSW